MEKRKLFIRNFKDFHELIENLKDEGYDSLHLPGGKSLNGDHSSFVVIWVLDRVTLDTYLLAVPYNSSFHLKEEKTKIKDSKKFYKKENPIQTAQRELQEETGLKIPQREFYIFHEVRKGDNRQGFKKNEHIQYFLSLKRVMYVEDLNFKEIKVSGAGETANPIFIPKKLVPRYLFQKHYFSIKR